jgi:hypothetical protein
LRFSTGNLRTEATCGCLVRDGDGDGSKGVADSDTSILSAVGDAKIECSFTAAKRTMSCQGDDRVVQLRYTF